MQRNAYIHAFQTMILVCVVALGGVIILPLAHALPPSSLAAPEAMIDAAAEIATAKYDASVTQAAYLREADAELRRLHTQIEALTVQVKSGSTTDQGKLTRLKEQFVADLAERERAYAQKIAVFRRSLENIASDPERLKALAHFNTGDRRGAIAILDELDTATADALKAIKKVDTALLAQEAHQKGDFTTLELIDRFEEITTLDPRVHWTWIQLGRLYKEAGNLAQFDRCARAASEIANDKIYLSGFLDSLGDLHMFQGFPNRALQSYQTSREIRVNLAITDPTNTVWQHDLSVSLEKIGNAQMGHGNVAGALLSYQESNKIAEWLAALDPQNTQWQRNLSVSLVKVGTAQVDQGNFANALRNYQASLEIAKRLAAIAPKNTEWRRDLSISLENVGNVQELQRDLDAALQNYQESREIREQLTAANPRDKNWQRDLSITLDRIGDVQLDRGDLASALQIYQESREIKERLAAANPKNKNWQRDLSISLDRIGDVQLDLGNLAGALQNYQKSRKIRGRLVAANPRNPKWQHDLSISLIKVGNVQIKQGDHDSALQNYKERHAIAERLSAIDPQNANWQRDLIISNMELNEVTGDSAYNTGALKIAKDMTLRGTLAPKDAWMIDELNRRAAKK